MNKHQIHTFVQQGRDLVVATPFLPLILFMIVARQSGDWPLAFMVGGTHAAVWLWALLTSKQITDRYALGGNFFLAIGGIVFSLGIGPLQLLYKELQFAGFFVAIAIVGIITTLKTSAGFIGSSSTKRAKVRMASWILVGIAIAAAAFAYALHQNYLISIIVPLLALVGARVLLKMRFLK